MITIDERSKINLINYLKKETKRIEGEVHKAVADTANIMKINIKEDAPKDTGTLKASVSRRKLKAGEHVVRVQVPYAGYVESIMNKRDDYESYWNKNLERGRDYLQNQLKKIK